MLREANKIRTVSLVLICLGVIIAVGSQIYLQTHWSWLPVDVPLPAIATATTQNFTVKGHGEYYAAVEAQRALLDESERVAKHKELSCHLGLPEHYPLPGYTVPNCVGTSRALDFQWHLFRDSTQIASGRYSDDLEGAYSTAAIAAEFAFFDLKPGHYRLEISSLVVDPVLAQNTPHLRIQLENDRYVGHAFQQLEGIALGSVILLIGLACFIFVQRRMR